MGIPVHLVGETPDFAGWFQALGTLAAIGFTWIIARSDRRAEIENEKTQAARREAALRTMTDAAHRVFIGLAKKAKAGKFTRDNVQSSLHDAEAVGQAFARLDLLSLNAVETEVVLGIIKHLRTAARRVDFIRDHIVNGTAPARPIEFDSLVRQSAALRSKLR